MLGQLKKDSAVNSIKKMGADLLLQELVKQKVKVVFGYPGGAVLPLYDAIYRNSFHNILVRHEQGAIHSAEGFAKSTGEVGVAFVTSGPGATNAITGIADAKSDSVPLVVFTGQVATTVLGTNAFQEAKIIEITKPITKASLQVTVAKQLPEVVRRAFKLAVNGRPGPVVVDLPKNVMTESVSDSTNLSEMSENPLKMSTAVRQKLVEKLQKSKKPILLIGGGILSANASREVRQFIEKYQIPVVSTLLGLGVVPKNEKLFLGMGGMHGTYAANMALSECDFLLNIGSRFDDRLATKPAEFAPKAWIAHLDIDPHELNKIIKADLAEVADAKDVFQQLLKADFELGPINQWYLQLRSWQKKISVSLSPARRGYQTARSC